MSALERLTPPRGATRALASGLAGTVVMTATTKAEAVLRGESGQPVDYDDSRIPVHFLERVISHRFRGGAEGFVNEVIHFGYGSAAGLLRAGLEGRVRRPGTAFFVLTWGAEVVALPLLDLAPPVWRWRRDVLITSMAQHAVFAAVTDLVYRSLGPTPGDDGGDDDQA